ncbi:MAG: hypothetical protein KGH93_01470 [Patescibacteria group bacterium]|nr:hypothetical protein [Patescibacteria group bacterium]MDE1945850.1 hypothetical protein [Patescibacteria group bacterium]
MNELIFLDTETTGNVIGTDRLCQVSYAAGDTIRTEYFKPPLPVSVKSSSITHITNKMLADKPPFSGSAMAKELAAILKKGILVAHNAKFDISMLEAEKISVPRFICTLRMARYLDRDDKIPEYGLQFLRYFLDLDIPKHTHAHDAEGDVIVLRALFGRLLAKMAEETGSEKTAIETMVEISKNPVILRRLNFGKYKDKSFEDVLAADRQYLEWLLRTKVEGKDNDEDLVYTLKHHLGR